MPTTSEILYPGEDTLWSVDRAYRYFLRRPVDGDLDLRAKPPVGFLLLNPSTADETQDDPTVRRCRRYAMAWGYGEVIVLNAFAYRATDPNVMRAQEDPVGPKNDQVITNTAATLIKLGGTLVCGWGNHGTYRGRGSELRELLKPYPVKAFPYTGVGEPGHPLYLRKDIRLGDLNND